MQKLFNHILVPVDFSERSSHTVEKAADMALTYQCDILLLHVVSRASFLTIPIREAYSGIPFTIIDNRKELEYKMEQLKQLAMGKASGRVNIRTAITEGEWEEVVAEAVSRHSIDLILMGQQERSLIKRGVRIDPDKIAGRTDTPVLTVPDNRRLTHLYSIVMPVTDFLPVRKLLYGIYIASQYTTTIKLLGIENDRTRNKVEHYLQRAYRLINENCRISIELETVSGENVAQVISHYSANSAVDLIIINPGMQSRLPGFFSSFLGGILQQYSTPPVLTVNPV